MHRSSYQLGWKIARQEYDEARAGRTTFGGPSDALGAWKALYPKYKTLAPDLMSFTKGFVKGAFMEERFADYEIRRSETYLARKGRDPSRPARDVTKADLKHLSVAALMKLLRAAVKRGDEDMAENIGKELDRRGGSFRRDVTPKGGYALQVRGKTVSRHRLLPAARKAAKARALRDHRIVVVLRVSEDGKRTKPVYTFGVDGKQRNLVYRHGASHRE